MDDLAPFCQFELNQVGLVLITIAAMRSRSSFTASPASQPAAPPKCLASLLRWSGNRCCTTTKARLGSAGIALNSVQLKRNLAAPCCLDRRSGRRNLVGRSLGAGGTATKLCRSCRLVSPRRGNGPSAGGTCAGVPLSDRRWCRPRPRGGCEVVARCCRRGGSSLTGRPCQSGAAGRRRPRGSADDRSLVYRGGKKRRSGCRLQRA